MIKWFNLLHNTKNYLRWTDLAHFDFEIFLKYKEFLGGDII